MTVTKTSDDYVREILNLRKDPNKSSLNREAKQQKISMAMQGSGGLQKIATGMIGEIQLRLRYQGVARQVLVEKSIDPTQTPEYPVMDEFGKAYILNPTDGEVRTKMFEGTKVRPEPFRVASNPTVREEDLIRLTVDIVEWIQDETKQAIMRKEDQHLFDLLTTALVDYSNAPEHTITPDHRVVEGAGYFTWDSLNLAASMVDAHNLNAATIIINPGSYRDIHRWSIEAAGWDLKNKLVAGEQITQLGGFNIVKSMVVPPNTMWVLPEPNFLGVMPIFQSLTATEVPEVTRSFHTSWVVRELIAMAVLNPRAIARVTKS